MKRELKDKKIVIRVTETQFKKLAESILDDDISLSQFIREAIREKLKWFFQRIFSFGALIWSME